MPATKNMRKKLDYILRSTGRAESEIVAQVFEAGLDEVYRKQIADAYITGRISRQKAIAELGKDLIDDLDYAREALEADVRWGLKGA